MSDGKFDFSKLKSEISSRKSEITTKEVALGKVPAGAIRKNNKKEFIKELVTSMHTGVKTSASEAVRTVSETVEMRKGLPPAVAKNTGKYIPPRTNNQYVPLNENVAPLQRNAADEWGIPSGVERNGYGEREDLFDQNLRKQMEDFDRMKMTGNPVAAQMMRQPQYGQQPQYIVEQQGAGNQIMTEDRNLEKLVEGAFKNVLTEIYTKQKIQEALTDFLKSDDFVKVVGQAINEIAKRNKQKQANK
jgi:hypothetical protein